MKDLRELDSKAKESEVKSLLAGKCYTLGEFTALDNSSCYGIVPINHDYESGFAIVPTKYTNISLDGDISEYTDSGSAAMPTKYANINVSDVDIVISGDIDTPSEVVLTLSQGIRWWLGDNIIYVLDFWLLAGVLALLSYYH